MKISFEYLALELTRRCNMRCAHCLRGEAQEVDVDFSYIDSLFNQTQLIGRLFLTGGEPTLNLSAMSYIVDELCDKGIPLLNLELYTNGLRYDEKFIEIIRAFKQVIDVSCQKCFATEYTPENETSRCIVGVSLDKYHEQHDICEKNYARYKQELAGVADVVRILHGNLPKKYGRAKCLVEQTIDQESIVYRFYPKQRIEVLDKDHSPACQVYDTYRLFDPAEKLVCCPIYMDAHGMLSSDSGGALEYTLNDAFPKICHVSTNDIWGAILRYNETRVPCAQWQAETISSVRKDRRLQAKDVMAVMFPPIDAQDEPTVAQLRDALKDAEKYGHNGAMLRKMIQQLKLSNTNWREIVQRSTTKAYYPGDTRGSKIIAKPQQDHESTDGIRCRWCRKVIKYQGRNIHCAPGDGGLVCEYCGRTTSPA